MTWGNIMTRQANQINDRMSFLFKYAEKEME